MRILFVTMAESVHAARWINQVTDQGWDVHLFPVANVPLHSAYRNLTAHPLFITPPRKDPRTGLRQHGLPKWPFPHGSTWAELRLDRWTRGRMGFPARLAKLIRRLKPDLIHCMEMQHAGYVLSDALAQLRTVPPIIYSSWGSDISHFGPLAEHASRVRNFLSACDYFIPDCQRDVRLSREFGFTGEVLGVFPGGGGFDVARMQSMIRPGAASTRRVIALKGYHDDAWAGRALVGLHAIQLCAGLLGDYEVAIFSAKDNVRYAAEFLARSTGIKIRILGPSSHETILKLMGEARASIGLSISDGTPNAMLEAMIMGALPIQSDTVSTAETISDGVNGLLVPPEDPHAVAGAIRRALADERLVDAASLQNTEWAKHHLDASIIKPQVVAAYRKAAEQGRRSIHLGTTSVADRTCHAC